MKQLIVKGVFLVYLNCAIYSNFLFNLPEFVWLLGKSLYDNFCFLFREF